MLCGFSNHRPYTTPPQQMCVVKKKTFVLIEISKLYLISLKLGSVGLDFERR